jgi:nitrogen fixation-related uncharacterized protein
MNEVKERTILQEGLVKVTNLRTLIGTQTYSISDIKSVNLTKQAKSYRPFWLVLVGVLLILWAMVDETGQFMEFFNIGICLVVIGITAFLWAKPSYMVQIGGPTGEKSILSSSKISFVQEIVKAINNAIAERGG